MLDKEASIYLMISMIFNQSCKSSVAFKVPRELLNRLKMESYDLCQIEVMGFNVLNNAILLKPCLHRFPENMSKYLFNSIHIINKKFNSDPRNIWRNKKEQEIIKNLKMLSGIGNHKAIQCLIYLQILGEIEEISKNYIEYMQLNCSNFFNNINNDLFYIRNL